MTDSDRKAIDDLAQFAAQGDDDEPIDGDGPATWGQLRRVIEMAGEHNGLIVPPRLR